MYYIDTSVLVAVLVREKTSDRVRSWFAERSPDQLSISAWTITEISSALALKVRTANINDSERASALSQFDYMMNYNLMILGVRKSHFRMAADYANRSKSALRGGDALHLAIASSRSLTVVTLDRRLTEAGPSLGISTELIA